MMEVEACPPPGLEQSSSENPASFIAITAVSIGWLFRMPAAALMRSECGICLGMMLRDNVWLISDRIGLCEAELLSLAQDGLIFFEGQSEVGCTQRCIFLPEDCYLG